MVRVSFHVTQMRDRGRGNSSSRAETLDDVVEVILKRNGKAFQKSQEDYVRFLIGVYKVAYIHSAITIPDVKPETERKKLNDPNSLQNLEGMVWYGKMTEESNFKLVHMSDDGTSVLTVGDKTGLHERGTDVLPQRDVIYQTLNLWFGQRYRNKDKFGL